MATNARLKNDRGTNSLESNSSATGADSLLEQLQFWAWDGGDATEMAAAAAVTRATTAVAAVAVARSVATTMAMTMATTMASGKIMVSEMGLIDNMVSEKLWAQK